MLFINATLSKNQPYKHKNQINKVPTISKQDYKELFSKYIYTTFFTTEFSEGETSSPRSNVLAYNRIEKKIAGYKSNVKNSV